jgi:hypothetical protein
MYSLPEKIECSRCGRRWPFDIETGNDLFNDDIWMKLKICPICQGEEKEKIACQECTTTFPQLVLPGRR